MSGRGSDCRPCAGIFPAVIDTSNLSPAQIRRAAMAAVVREGAHFMDQGCV